VAHSVVKEVDRLAIAVEETKASLRSFRKYVPADLIRIVLATREEAGLGGERRTMTISFCDLADFTTLSEQLSPEDLLRHLGDYFSPLSSQILASGGTVDKYIGDAIMAFWGAPAPTPNHAIAACTAALRNQATLAELRPRWTSLGMPELHARIGIHTGEVVVGNIGCLTRLNYTVVGDPVNVASRLEGLGKHYGASILIGEPTYQEARSAVIARPVDWVSVKGKTHGLKVFELLALKEDATPELEELTILAEEALGLYRRREWSGAIRLFREILRIRPGDGPAMMMIARCLAFQVDPPGENWDGVHRMASK
jgi:adenylate cyclase